MAPSLLVPTGMFAEFQPRKPRNRRNARRFKMFGEIDARLIAGDVADVPLLLLDISATGFAVKSPIQFTEGAMYYVQLTAPPLADVSVRAASVHCSRIIDEGNPWYIAGFAFTAETVANQRGRIMSLIDHAVNAQLIDHLIAG